MNNETRDGHIFDTHAIVKTIAEQVKRHDKTLYGNGQPGLCKRLQVMETTLSVKGRMYTAFYTLFVAGAGSVAGVFFSKVWLKS